MPHPVDPVPVLRTRVTKVRLLHGVLAERPQCVGRRCPPVQATSGPGFVRVPRSGPTRGITGHQGAYYLTIHLLSSSVPAMT